MPRKPRVEFEGAIYHVLSRGDRQENIFLDDIDRHDFVKTLAEACKKTGWQVHAYCLMRNHFHIVLETPSANLVAGMAWLLSTYTNRFNNRHKLSGHLFSGRYKSLIVDAAAPGYLKTVCDYVHLNPVRARILASEERLLAYPWSSFPSYLASPRHRPSWIRTDRVLGEHGFQKDTAATRKQFERRLELRRASEKDDEQLKQLRNGWYFGPPEFKALLLEQMEECLGEHHAGELHRESAELKAARIIKEELTALGWKEKHLAEARKSDPRKLAIAARVRSETTLPLKWIATRLHLGTFKGANTNLHKWTKQNVGNQIP